MIIIGCRTFGKQIPVKDIQSKMGGALREKEMLETKKGMKNGPTMA